MTKRSSARVLGGCLVFCAALGTAGCGPREDIKIVDLDKTVQLPSPSTGAVIRIGLIPEEDIRVMAQRYEPLAAYLNKKMNVPVKFVYPDNYADVCDKFIYRQLDAAFFGSFSYALTRARTGIEPLVRPETGGVSTYRGFIITSAQTGIRTVADMKGKRLSMVHRATFAGYLYPKDYFSKRGVADSESYFSRVTFAGSHDRAIADVLRGQSDVAAVKDLVYQRMVADNPLIEKQLVVLAASEPVPANAFCVRQDMDPALKVAFKAVFGGMAQDPAAASVLRSLGDVTRFVETRDEDYQVLYAAIKDLGIDLHTYPYDERFGAGLTQDKPTARSGV